MRQPFALLTGRHDDRFHRPVRNRFATEREAIEAAEQGRLRGEYDWWTVVELGGDRIIDSDERFARPGEVGRPGAAVAAARPLTPTSSGPLSPVSSVP